MKEKVNILGMCFTGHGASLAAYSSQQGWRALSLERFTGKKYAIMLSDREIGTIHEPRDPISQSIRDSFIIGYGKLPPIFSFEQTFLPFLKATIGDWQLRPRDFDLVVGSNCFFAVNPFGLIPEVRRIFRNAELHMNLEHHQIHQRQAFHGSHFEDAAVLTMDGCGEALLRRRGKRLALTLGGASRDGFRTYEEHTFPESSPGQLYTHFSEFLGFRQGEEGKTMGLAPYGRPRIFEKLAPHLALHENGSFEFSIQENLHPVLEQFARPRKSRKDPLRAAHSDIAYAAQALLELVYENAVRALEKRSPSRNLCIAGGVGLNSVANEKIFRKSRFEDIYIAPNCGDTGMALGCALYGLREHRGLHEAGVLEHDFLGPEHDDRAMDEAIAGAGLKPIDSEDVIADTARFLAEGKIVGWFDGGSEYGPRALGHRSILADPRTAKMKDHLNQRVKHREAYRPFAPVVLEEEVSDWFEYSGPNRFMLRVAPVREDKRALVPAITHVDGSARLQTVDSGSNPRFYRLIQAFKQRTGVPVILNTSFNIAGKPIVETPADAVECYAGTGIDVLVLGDRILKKENVPGLTLEEAISDVFKRADFQGMAVAT